MQMIIVHCPVGFVMEDSEHIVQIDQRRIAV